MLGFLFPVNHAFEAAGSGYTPSGSATATYAPYQPYFDMNPKLNADQAGNLGSQAGTVRGTGPLTVRNDRLYASVDEFLFQVPSSTGTAGSSRTVNPPPPLSGTATTSGTAAVPLTSSLRQMRHSSSSPPTAARPM